MVARGEGSGKDPGFISVARSELPGDRSGYIVVVGLAVSGEAVSRYLMRRGLKVVAIDDSTGAETRERAEALGIDLVQAPDFERLRQVVAGASLAVVSPGVPPSHPVFDACLQLKVPVTTEIELAAAEVDADTLVVAVTGTNGKTTVATLVGEMLAQANIPCSVAGNIGLPLLDALPAQLGVGRRSVLVVEVSSFQLALCEAFRPDVAVWLNVTPDHLDAHASFQDYVAAKARIWANQGPDDVAVANNDDPIVISHARRVRSRLVTFGLSSGDYKVFANSLVGPSGEIAPVQSLARRFPHDIANALAATAAAVSAGAPVEACAKALSSFRGLSHRIETIGDVGGVTYVDDSKATTPASVLAALDGFDSVVLIAGGRNKGLDLSVLSTRDSRIKAVVAIGEAAAEVEAAFRGREVVTAHSMREAVETAACLASPGDIVLLSPGCASFDWYGSYAERGRDFASEVKRLAESQHSESRGSTREGGVLSVGEVPSGKSRELSMKSASKRRPPSAS